MIQTLIIILNNFFYNLLQMKARPFYSGMLFAGTQEIKRSGVNQG
jgi:hypothetical protein